jgi:hypothetical protein
MAYGKRITLQSSGPARKAVQAAHFHVERRLYRSFYISFGLIEACQARLLSASLLVKYDLQNRPTHGHQCLPAS